MRLMEIKNIDYEDFHFIRHKLWSNDDSKFGPLSCEYDPRNLWGRIWFNDTKHIPFWLLEMKESGKHKITLS